MHLKAPDTCLAFYAESKKDKLYCCEYQEGFPYIFRIKHAFLLSALLVTPAPLHAQTSPLGRKPGGQRILEWESVITAQDLTPVNNIFISTQVNKHDIAFWYKINIEVPIQYSLN